MDPTTPLDARPLDVANTFQDAFRAIAANFGTFLVIGLISTVPGSIMGFVIQVVMSDQLSALQDPQRVLGALSAMFGAYVIMMVVLMALSAIGQGAAIYATVEHLVGRKASVGDALRVGLGRFVWLFLGSLLVGLIVGFGSIFCLLPGMIAWVWLSAAMPAIAVEDIGPLQAIQRSIELTEGHRVTISIVYALLFGVLFGFSCCIAGPAGAISGAGAAPGEMPDPFAPGQIVMQILNFFISLGFFMLMTSVISVVYARLRGLREGVDAGALAKVFS